jgi:hypothetical protein
MFSSVLANPPFPMAREKEKGEFQKARIGGGGLQAVVGTEYE